MADKRSESQFPDPNKHDVPEGIGWEWTAESQNEQAESQRRKERTPRRISREAEDVENSKRSRGERI